MLEKDVETAYIEWVNGKRYERVLGRQIKLPYGVLDVLSVFVSPGGCSPHVSEIKLDKVNEKSLTQVMGYASQIEVLIGCNVDVLDGNHEDYTPVECGSVLVGTEMTPMVERVYRAFGVSFIQHFVNHGGIEFHEEQSPLMYNEDTSIAGPLAKLAKITTAWRKDHRRRSYTCLHTPENYEYLINSTGKASIDGFENTVAYWKRKP